MVDRRSGKDKHQRAGRRERRMSNAECRMSNDEVRNCKSNGLPDEMSQAGSPYAIAKMQLIGNL